MWIIKDFFFILSLLLFLVHSVKPLAKSMLFWTKASIQLEDFAT